VSSATVQDVWFALVLSISNFGSSIPHGAVDNEIIIIIIIIIIIRTMFTVLSSLYSRDEYSQAAANTDQ